ncbi:MAG: tRNA (adenosine(37)-N6)-threonylcarbamoyltransferase complex dimerization subunit type 1 TsaB [Ruminococcaceae bacterium]|nr:tRNA (adenosine(37)-N6)-threonylcarbamoyltransferase complex dimerization subunit type 1 TsaB [Oscillospiraceae bacterium]
MRILALETSAKSVSAAVAEDGAILAYSFQNTGLTHSRTLLPMVDRMLENAELPLPSVDAFAVAAGPGSFTGLRIGVSALKGLAWAADKPCAGVSTLLAMAHNYRRIAPDDTLLVCAMDARRSQVYNALFTLRGGELVRLCDDRAVGLDELAGDLRNDPRQKIVLGDGAGLAHGYLTQNGVACALAPETLRWQNAAGVALAAQQAFARGEAVTAQELAISYLRVSQAERERNARLEREQLQNNLK